MRRAPRTVLAALLAAAVWGTLPGPSRAGIPDPFPPPPSWRPAQEDFRDWPGDAERQRPWWLPWSDYSFLRARLYDRPVLFVLHAPWSRPSQRMLESVLVDPGVLRTANEGWISVLLRTDRRPDIQDRYQTGVWPTIAFLLPDGNPILSMANPEEVAKPITAGTVTPEQMTFLLEQGRLYWDRQQDTLRRVGREWAALEAEDDTVAGPISEEASDRVARWLAGNADRTRGGFGAAPKFVISGLAEYGALREARQAPTIADHARFSLEQMVASPLYDRRHGGVHRIAAAPEWGGIQHEKLLERNALLLRELAVSLRQRPSDPLAAALRGTAGFLTGTLARPGGGFFLAQAADPTSDDGGRYWTGPPGAAPAPPVDRLVLAGPNALAGAALLRASVQLDDPALAAAGRGALDLVLSAWERGRGVPHVIEPNPDGLRFLGAQADAAFGLVDAYETAGDPRYLDAAEDIARFALLNLRSGADPRLLDRLPEVAPLGILANPRRPVADNVRLARALRRLAVHGRLDGTALEECRKIVGAYAGDLGAYQVHGTEPALAVEELAREPLVVRLEAPPGDPRGEALRREALRLPRIWTVVTTAPAEEGRAPAAVLQHGGKSVRVIDPAALGREAAKVTS